MDYIKKKYNTLYSKLYNIYLIKTNSFNIQKCEKYNKLIIFERENKKLLKDTDLIEEFYNFYKLSICSICYDENITKYGAYECKHGCCLECIKKIERNNKVCPFCRRRSIIIRTGDCK